MAAGPYVLRPLLHDVPLSAEGNDEDIKINCVDYLGELPYDLVTAVHAPSHTDTLLCAQPRR